MQLQAYKLVSRKWHIKRKDDAEGRQLQVSLYSEYCFTMGRVCVSDNRICLILISHTSREMEPQRSKSPRKRGVQLDQNRFLQAKFQCNGAAEASLMIVEEMAKSRRSLSAI